MAMSPPLEGELTLEGPGSACRCGRVSGRTGAKAAAELDYLVVAEQQPWPI
jgi:hypothetical protein